MKPVTLDMARPSGERERFVALYGAHGGAVLAYARRLIAADEAEDIRAETFLVAWRRRRDVPADALPWLYAVAATWSATATGPSAGAWRCTRGSRRSRRSSRTRRTRSCATRSRS